MMKYFVANCDCIDLTGLENISLVYLDPPYGSEAEDKYYGVGLNHEDYLEYMTKRLAKIRQCLAPSANVIIHVDFKLVHYLKVRCDFIFGRENFRNEIVWCYSSPSVAKVHMPRKHDNLLWYGMGDYTFNQPTIAYNKNLKVGGKTAWSQDADTSAYLEKGKKLEDWWTDIPSLCRNEPEKTGWPTQKPKKLMRRIIEAFSDEGQSVYDPFCGSGSFLEEAVIAGRFAYGADISEKAVEITNKRLGTL